MELERYRLTENDKTNLRILRPRRAVKRMNSPFLRGPIPLSWLQRAMRSGGAAISVGVILWYFRGLKKTSVFKVGTQDIAGLIDRSWLTAKRGLLALEGNGLITITRHQGRKHVIEIREVESEIGPKEF